MLQPASSTPTDVVYILGVGRSGSTLLEMILDQVDGFVSVGELRYIWRVLRDNYLCGCGHQIRACPFWNQVIEAAFGSVQACDPAALLELRLSVDRLWRNPQLAFPALRSRRYRANLEAHGEVLDRLYAAIRTVSGARYVVDASKQPSHGYILAARPALNLHLVHLVRDSRAVGYSWQRRKLRPEIHWRAEYMPVFGTAYMLLTWYIETVFGYDLLRTEDDPLIVRYEDFARWPRRTVERVLGHIGADAPSTPFLAPDRVTIGQSHSVSGNPIRFRKGPVQIRPDVEWRERMRPVPRAVVTTMTWPFLVRHGYLGREAG